jgi:hypothetical protein
VLVVVALEPAVRAECVVAAAETCEVDTPSPVATGSGLPSSRVLSTASVQVWVSPGATSMAGTFYQRGATWNHVPSTYFQTCHSQKFAVKTLEPTFRRVNESVAVGSAARPLARSNDGCVRRRRRARAVHAANVLVEGGAVVGLSGTARGV